MAYTLQITRSADKTLGNLPQEPGARITAAILALADDPRPPGCKKLRGQGDYRIRVGNYRAIYAVDDERQTVTILRIGHRRDIYRR